MLSDLYALISSVTTAPVSPDNLPEQATFPAVVYTLTSNDVDHLLDGTPAGTTTSEVRLDIVATDNAGGDTLATTILTALDGYKGAFGNRWGVWTLTEEDENGFAYGDGGDTWLFVRSQTYNIRHVVKST